jgi:hypothetical protein
VLFDLEGKQLMRKERIIIIKKRKESYTRLGDRRSWDIWLKVT